ncbi:MAG: casein kinase 1 family protein, partial [archaeon]|nr:casein kinase 1 family protein [archaeon]
MEKDNSKANNLPITKDIILNKRYLLKVKDRLGAGSFGQIYKGQDIKTKEDIAIKIESTKIEAPQLMHEYNVLKKLSSSNLGFPKVHQIFPYEDVLILIMEILGENLETLMQKTPNKKFSLKTTMMITIQVLKLLKSMHENNYIHRDIKPENFVIGLKRKENKLHMIDFGISRTIFDKKKNHIPYREDKNFMGNPKFCSIYTLMGIEQSRRDDLEAVGYMIVYFLKGNLPWNDIKCKNKIERNIKIKEKKIEVTPNGLCEGLPPQIKEYFDYVRGLQFEEEPKYDYLISIMNKILKENNLK